jgi:hypothetical protein
MADKTTIIDKVRKLYQLAKDQGPKTHEGRNAWNQAKRLMAKHGLTHVDVFPPKPPEAAHSPIDPLRDFVMNPDGPGTPRHKVDSVEDGVSKVVKGLRDLFQI